MASTYSTNLALELIGNNDQAGTWGNTTNNNLGTLIEQAISGYVTQAITDGADTVITIPNGASGVARNMTLELTGALTAARNLIVPANRKLYFIFNNTTGSQSVTVKVSGQTGVSVPNGQKMVLVCNGTDVVTAVTYAASMSVGSLTLSSGAANGVAYLNASKVVTAGTALTFDGVQTLSVFGTGNSVLHLEGSTTNNGVMRFRNGTTGSLSGLIGNNSKDLIFESNGAAEQMRLTSAGNFGIGTASPANYSNYRNLAINGTTGGNIDMLSNGTKVGNLFNDGTNFYAYNVIAGSMVFGTNNTERMRLDSSGNLLVGTTSAGNARFVVRGPGTTSATASLEGATSGGATRFLVSDDGLCRWYGTSNSETMRLDNAGNLGIGTASPSEKLEVSGTVAGALATRIVNLSSDSAAVTRLAMFTQGGTWNINANRSDFSLAFATGTTERMRLDSSGNLGIGTGGLTARGNLDVSSGNLSGSQTRSIHLGYSASDFYGFRVTNINDAGATFAGTFRIQRGTGAAWNDDLVVTNAGNVAIGTASPQAATPTLNKGLYIESSTNNDVVGYSLYVLDGVNNRRGAMFLDDSTGLYGWDTTASSGVPSYVWRTGAIERMRLTSDGDVGIGTASPTYRIDVLLGAGSGNIARFGQSGVSNGYTITTNGSALTHEWANGGSVSMSFTSSGNLGIGTTSPVAKLSVQDASVPKFALQVGAAERAFLSYTESTFTTRLDSDGPLVFAANNAEVGRFDVLGNLGIGTASPAARLQVKSSAAQAVNIEGTTARGGGNIFAAFLDPTGRKGYFGYGSASDDGFYLYNEMNAPMVFATNSTERMRITGAGNIVAGASAALATTATDGFLYVPTCAGTPTGTPTAITGMAPIVVNTTNNKLYFYSGGAWRDAGP